MSRWTWRGEPLYSESEVAAMRSRSFWAGMILGAGLALAIVAMLAT